LGSNAARKRIFFWAKIAVSILVLYLVFRGTDLALIPGLLAGSRKPLWIAGLLLMVLSQVISTFRWHTLLKPLDFDLPWFRVFRIYFTGMFFSLFLPTLVGGDGIKTYYIARDWKRVPAALYTLLADRTVGLAAMLIFVIFGLPVVRPVWPTWLIAALALLVPLTYGFLLLLPRLSTRILLVSRRLREVPRERLFVYWEDWRSTARAWVLSLGVHLCLVVSHICLAYSLGLDVPWAAWAAVYPVTALVGFLPISLSGVGPREAAYVYLIGLFGISRETALAFGIMWFSVVLANGLLGGLFYVFGGELSERDAARK
jgi:uncharacterized membrane protein YbhN (UPF0104 family)